VNSPVFCSTVLPGQLPTCWLRPVSILNTVDLPTLGCPASATVIELEIGDWKLEIGDLRLGTGDWLAHGNTSTCILADSPRPNATRVSRTIAIIGPRP
jgi:hypothetical protein